MPLDIKVPTVGESIAEVIVAEWLKPEGAWVAQDEAVVSLETDKVNVEIPAPGPGFLGKFLKQKGESARVGDVIGHIEPVFAQLINLSALVVTKPCLRMPSIAMCVFAT